MTTVAEKEAQAVGVYDILAGIGTGAESGFESGFLAGLLAMRDQPEWCQKFLAAQVSSLNWAGAERMQILFMEVVMAAYPFEEPVE